MAEHVDEAALREQPLGELVKELASQTSTLVRQELDLAKAEMTQKGKEAGAAGAMFGAAGVVALLAADRADARVHRRARDRDGDVAGGVDRHRGLRAGRGRVGGGGSHATTQGRGRRCRSKQSRP